MEIVFQYSYTTINLTVHYSHRWEIKEGDSFEVGDLLAEIETDKATLGFEAADEGVLAKILVPSGAKNIEIGAPVAIVVDDESHVAKFANYTLGS